MDHELLDLARWDALGDGEREAAGRALARELPAPFAFTGIEAHELGEQQHRVATFDWHGAKFVLIPGGEVTLGYDRDRPFVPTAAQWEDWEGTREEYGVGLDEYLDYSLTPLRTVTIAPFLVEAVATDCRRLPGEDYLDRWTPLREVARRIAADGFRLPTSDEWEHACAAGARTLFRWGDDCPTDHYPAGDGREHAWDLHRRPNAFGLRIGGDPYKWEYCAEPAVVRGGDGGGTICGGAGFLAGWLTLASAFCDRNGAEHYRDRELDAHLCRAYSLS